MFPIWYFVTEEVKMNRRYVRQCPVKAIESADGSIICIFLKVQTGFQSNTTIYAIIRRSKPVVHLLTFPSGSRRRTKIQFCFGDFHFSWNPFSPAHKHRITVKSKNLLFTIHWLVPWWWSWQLILSCRQKTVPCARRGIRDVEWRV